MFFANFARRARVGYWAVFIALLLPGWVAAQSTSGSIYGQAESGEGVTVAVENADTGFKREKAVDAIGRFVFTALPPGRYTVVLKRDGAGVQVRNATVVAGVGTSADFQIQDEIEVIRIDEIEAVGGAIVTPIDVSTAQTTTIYSAQRMEVIPVAKDITSVALLAPGTTRGDGAFGNLASFGGSSVAENAYYVNGFNVTNLFKNLSYSQIPFYAIAEQQVITGGYGPEYGLSTGGVINLTTMKGTNQWLGGAAVTWQPDSLREKSPKTYTPNGEAFRDYALSAEEQTIYDLWVGGPLIANQLFVYAIAEFTDYRRNTERSVLSGSPYEKLEQENPFGLAKLSWNVNDDHIVDFTYIKDTRKYEYAEFPTAPDAEGFRKPVSFAGTDYLEEGGDIYVLGYTGYLTDDLTLTAQYGRLKSAREEYQIAANGQFISYDGVVGNFDQPGCPYVLMDGTYRAAHPDEPVSSCYITNVVPTINGEDERKAGRIDLEWRAPGHFLGVHTLKGGYERDRWSTFFGESYAGGVYYRYYTHPDDGDYVRVRHFQTGANVYVNTDAFYLKDSWDLENGVLLSLGIRNDSFENFNGARQAYVKQDNIWQPRLGVVWDVFEDASQKVYGSYGIYSLPIAATVAVRGASASIFDSQTFYYSDIDPVTGTPTLTEPRSERIFLNAHSGVTPNPASVASGNLDPTIQDEFILGYQAQLWDGWTGGVRATFRELKTTIDDMCDWRPFELWAEQNIPDDPENPEAPKFNPAPDFPGCFLFNPGESMQVAGDINSDGVIDEIYLTAEMIGSPKVERRYISAEFVLEKTTPQWFAQASYTWAHNYGNAEGLVKSDIGQDDTGVTQDFDFPELMRGAKGDLPNDRRHTLKGSGGFKFASDWSVSGSVLLQTGRPINCIGVDPVDRDIHYGASYFACGGRPVPRGTAGRTDTVFNLDLGLAWNPPRVPGLLLQAKVFNLLDGDAAIEVSEAGESALTSTDGSVSGAPLSTYRSVSDYQTPRYFQFTARYDFTL